MNQSLLFLGMEHKWHSHCSQELLVYARIVVDAPQTQDDNIKIRLWAMEFKCVASVLEI